MKKIIATITLGASLLITSPAMAYTVKSGDWSTKIARNHGLALKELAKANPQIKDLNKIYVGQYINTEKVRISSLTPQEKDLLSRLVEAEAGGEPYEGKVAVAEVVLNRVDNINFPDTVKDVIYQKNQFEPVVNGHINKVASNDSIRAVEEALIKDRKVNEDTLYFYNPKIATSHWLDSRETSFIIGQHVFKK